MRPDYSDTEDAALAVVGQAIMKVCSGRGRSVESVFAHCIRQALDEVIDGPRTGRWSINQLDAPEQTYIGTKVEIIVRAALEAEKGTYADCRFADHELEIKWSRRFAKWMIGPENIGSLCLGVCTDDAQDSFGVGLFVASAARVGRGNNRDKKKSLTAFARDNHVRWLVRDARLPRNFIADLPAQARQQIFAGNSAQERVRLLAESSPMQFIPRQAFQTVAMKVDGDPLRRLRQDSYNPDGLTGIALIGTKYGRKIIRKLGFESPLPKDHWLAVPVDKLRGIIP